MTLREEVARLIAKELGDQFDDALLNKSEWVERRGMGKLDLRYRDINEPYQCDYLSAADAILPLILSKAAEKLTSKADQMRGTVTGNTMALVFEDIAREIEMLGEG